MSDDTGICPTNPQRADGSMTRARHQSHGNLLRFAIRQEQTHKHTEITQDGPSFNTQICSSRQSKRLTRRPDRCQITGCIVTAGTSFNPHNASLRHTPDLHITFFNSVLFPPLLCRASHSGFIPINPCGVCHLYRTLMCHEAHAPEMLVIRNTLTRTRNRRRRAHTCKLCLPRDEQHYNRHTHKSPLT